MNTHYYLIIAKGRIRTSEIQSYVRDEQTGKYVITFGPDEIYLYNQSSVQILTNPTVLRAADYRITHDGRKLFNVSEIYEFKSDYGTYWHVCFKDKNEEKYEKDYEKSSLNITASCLTAPASKTVFDYLKQTAACISLRTADDVKLLSMQYEKLDYVGDDTVFAQFVQPSARTSKPLSRTEPVFPFGCNRSQYKAVHYALENQISIIQGPPGTGKTQTILNIIANLIIAGKTVQVVSNNNSATANVFEKLSKCGLEFVAAQLGNSGNKIQFITNQTDKYPGLLKTWTMDTNCKKSLFEQIKNTSQNLQTGFETEEELASVRQQLEELQNETKHFSNYMYENGMLTEVKKRRKPIAAETLFKIWTQCQNFEDKGRKPSFFFKCKCCFIYKIAQWRSFENDTTQIITQLQSLFYTVKQDELIQKREKLERQLASYNQKKLSEELTGKSLQYLKAELAERYGADGSRVHFHEEDLWKNYEAVQKEYPVTLSSAFCSRCSLSSKAEFDYIIIDEASQLDVATGALALSSAKNAVIVGDTMQLPNVIKDDMKRRLQSLFDSYHISTGYNAAEKSLLQSMCELFPHAPQTLLREHYRCSPKIINFCNQKFYGGQLIIMTENGDAPEVSVVKTVAGNHNREHMNQRQIDEITRSLLPAIPYPDEQIGIIAPYNAQVNALKAALPGRHIDIATVHKFQGREKDVIVISTVADTVTPFIDNQNMLNVAVSRAKKRLYLVVSGNEQPENSNTGDLIDYIEYNSGSIELGTIRSIFDLLYSQYTEQRIAYLKTIQHVSEYDSENLMYELIQKVLRGNNYSVINVICHQPLNPLLRDLNRLSEDERRYATNSATHVDFLLYNRVSKKTVLAVEVDGCHFHRKGTRQAERDEMKNHILKLYGIPLLRFPTNCSGEEEILSGKLREITGTRP